MKIEEFTVALHCGSDSQVVRNQIESLEELEAIYSIHWNNRIDRHPEMYASFSENDKSYNSNFENRIHNIY